MQQRAVNIITIDGPSGSGKGTISQRVAERLGYHFLDSGALYRLLALAADRHAIPLENEAALVTLAEHLDVQFKHDSQGRMLIILESEEVTDAIRTEGVASGASRVAALPAVREALLARQRAFAEAPGLVADGRDMGTVVFPAASVKVFLTASQEERAQRRYNQLKEKGNDVNLATLLKEIAERDERDASRSVAPLRPADDALVIDTTSVSIEEVTDQVLSLVDQRLSA